MPSFTRPQALRIALASVAAVVALQLFNGTACYRHDLEGHLVGLGFVAAGFLPGLVALFTRNPLRTVGAALLFAPWLVLAYVVDCVQAYAGGGASMIYVAVLLWGFCTSALGALLTGPLLRWVGVRVG
jgi:hypothetical protein